MRAALRPVVIGLCCGLAGCGTDGPLKLPATSAGVGNGQSAGASAPSGPSSATVNAATAGSSIKVGAKNVELVGVVFDPTCSTPVAPFDTTDNVEELARFGTSQLAENVGTYASQQMQQLADSVSGKKTAKPASPKMSALSPPLRRAAKRMNWLPMSVEDRYGAHLLDQMKAKIMPRDGRIGPKFYPKADALLAEVLAGVKQPYAYKFEAFVSTDSGSNAMALPGGRIVIDKALLDKPELRDKAYFAVAHEVGHVLQRHQTHALQARVVDALALKGSLPDMIKTMKSAGSEPLAVVQLLAGGKLLFEKHSEQQELQADSCGMRMLDDGKAADSRLLAAVTAFANSLPKPQPAAKEEDALAAVIDLVQRPVDAHPNTVERKKNLDEMLVELGKRPGLKKAVKPNLPTPQKAQALPTLQVKPKVN